MGLEQRPADADHYAAADEHGRLSAGPARYGRWKRLQRSSEQGDVHPLASGERVHAQHPVLVRPVGLRHRNGYDRQGHDHAAREVHSADHGPLQAGRIRRPAGKSAPLVDLP
uniref:(northern house mosquito) hypothetical protein n=1 Tax=Culex pipiens TaxID=7175 RepID=A0A8D8DHG4_CULPI